MSRSDCMRARFKRPIQALEPTSTSVTPRDDARLAPAVVVAHLTVRQKIPWARACVEESRSDDFPRASVSFQPHWRLSPMKRANQTLEPTRGDATDRADPRFGPAHRA